MQVADVSTGDPTRLLEACVIEEIAVCIDAGLADADDLAASIREQAPAHSSLRHLPQCARAA